MSSIYKFLTVSVVAIGLWGCNAEVTDFVTGGGIPIEDDDLPTIEPPNLSDFSIKLSPGQVRAEGNNVALEATITPTKQYLSNSSIDAEVTISATRVE